MIINKVQPLSVIGKGFLLLLLCVFCSQAMAKTSSSKQVVVIKEAAVDFGLDEILILVDGLDLAPGPLQVTLGELGDITGLCTEDLLATPPVVTCDFSSGGLPALGDYLLGIASGNNAKYADSFDLSIVEPGTTIVDGTTDGDLLTWDGVGNNWIAEQPATPGNNPASSMQPYQTVNFVIALQGVFPSRNSLDPFVGEIMLAGFNFAPRGWAKCDGQLLPIAQNSALFSLLGTQYGGDGRTVFGLPDLRGRVPVHQGTGPGLTNRSIGEKGGSETHTHN